MQKQTKIAIFGANGRMGNALIQAVESTQGVILGAAIVHPESDDVGIDAGEVAGLRKNGIACVANVQEVLDSFEVLIDFSSPQATLANLRVCSQFEKGIVVGTTGFSEAELAEFEALSQDIALVKSANFSTGVNLSLKLLELAARVMGGESDVEIVEAHHRHKVDSPSGTALAMGEAVAQALDRDLSEVACYGRQGVEEPRDSRTIGFSTVRGGDIVGDHTVMFLAEGERIEIAHKASSRMTFANGAVKAAIWLQGKKKGHYSMQDVLDI